MLVADKRDADKSKCLLLNTSISLRELRGQNSSVPEFTEDELREALSKMRSKGAPGPDDISPRFLKNLGPYAIKLLFLIFNLSQSPLVGKCQFQCFCNYFNFILITCVFLRSELFQNFHFRIYVGTKN